MKACRDYSFTTARMVLSGFACLVTCFEPATAAVPSPPSLTSPGSTSSSGTTETDFSPTFRWSASSGATGYGLYVKDLTTGILIYDNDNVANTTSLTISPGLVAGHQYRWNMRAKNASGWSTSYSSYRYFQMQGSVPAAPFLNSPGSTSSPGTTETDFTPTLQWSPSSGATGYGLYVRDLTTATLIYDGDYVAITTSLTLPSGESQAGTKYRCNVQAVSSADWRTVSSTLYLQTPTVTRTLTLTVSSSNPASGGNVGVSPSGMLIAGAAVTGFGV